MYSYRFLKYFDVRLLHIAIVGELPQFIDFGSCSIDFPLENCVGLSGLGV